MPTATVTSKGRVTIPVEIRRSLGLTSGSRVDFVPRADGSYELVSATGTVTSLKGCVRSGGTPVTLQEMDAAITEGAAAEYLR